MSQFTGCLIQGGLLEFLIQKQLFLPVCFTALYFYLFHVASTHTLTVKLPGCGEAVSDPCVVGSLRVGALTHLCVAHSSLKRYFTNDYMPDTALHWGSEDKDTMSALEGAPSLEDR